jgi:hypothetical protein
MPLRSLATLPLFFLLACADDKPAATPTPHTDAGSDAGAASRDAAQVPDADSADAGPDAARHYRLATTGTQLVVTGPALGLQLTEANVVGDSDVVAIHQEFYGVPWDAFETDTAPPGEWVTQMQRLASLGKDAKKPVFLSISMLNGTRESLAAKTRIESGQVKTQDDWSAKCYDFASAPDAANKRAAYQRYVTYMLQLFAPAYLNLAIEVNLFFEKCPAATPGLIALINDVYRAVKKQRVSTLVFPSFQIDHLYGYSADSCPAPMQREECFDKAYAVIGAIERDRFAMSSYPYVSAGFKSVTDLPADWFQRGAARYNEIALIAETGWPSTPIVVRAKDGSCPTYFSFDEPASLAYLARVLDAAQAGQLDLVTWWSDRDLVVDSLMTECPCRFDATWCSVLDVFRGPAAGPSVAGDPQLFGELVLKVFGSMGLRHYDGSPKPAHLARWNAARALPYTP